MPLSPEREPRRSNKTDRRGFFVSLDLKDFDVESLQTWWEMAQVAGAGASLVLGPVAWLLWKAYQKQIDYTRESDKNTLAILSDLTRLLEQDGKDDTNRHTEVIGILQAIKNGVDLIKAHNDARK